VSEAAQRVAEHRLDYTAAERAGYFAEAEPQPTPSGHLNGASSASEVEREAAGNHRGQGLRNREPHNPSLSALRYRDVVDAYADLEDALEHHEPVAASLAAWSWWRALDRLMQR